MQKELTWQKAIQKVLSDTGCSMHYLEIVDRILQDGLRENVGATPARTVSAIMTQSIAKEGENSPYQKVGRGEFVLRNSINIHEKGKPLKTKCTPKEVNDQSESQYDIITSFGMFWRRDLVDWSTQKILGVQQIGAEQVDFYKQAGIYLLYDGREVIYVGRSTSRPLGQRLYEHTFDRLSTRWDRFSWFGLLPVSEKGLLGMFPPNYLANKILPTLEAVLIEALEPRQNRKRGDDLAAVEYQQQEDPQLVRKKKKALLEAAMENI